MYSFSFGRGVHSIPGRDQAADEDGRADGGPAPRTELESNPTTAAPPDCLWIPQSDEDHRSYDGHQGAQHLRPGELPEPRRSFAAMELATGLLLDLLDQTDSL